MTNDKKVGDINVEIGDGNTVGQIGHTVINGPPPPSVSMEYAGAIQVSPGRWRHEWVVTLTASSVVGRLCAFVHSAVIGTDRPGDEGVRLRPTSGGIFQMGGSDNANPRLHI